MKLLPLFFISFVIVNQAFGFTESSKLVLEGHYQNKNLYVNNCFNDDGVGFAVDLVRVNGNVTSDAVNSSAFEIDFQAMGLKQGEPVVVQIEYYGTCVPKVLNPGALQPVPTFEVTEMHVNETGLLSWSTINESGVLPYSIEQFKWNKWVKIGEVNGIGSPESHSYEFQTILTSGQNKFRVIQKNLSGEYKASNKVAQITSSSPLPVFNYEKKSEVLVFTETTSYEVYDIYGQIRKRGRSNQIDFSNLEPGDYYINYDNTMEKFRKK